MGDRDSSFWFPPEYAEMEPADFGNGLVGCRWMFLQSQQETGRAQPQKGAQAVPGLSLEEDIFWFTKQCLWVWQKSRSHALPSTLLEPLSPPCLSPLNTASERCQSSACEMVDSSLWAGTRGMFWHIAKLTWENWTDFVVWLEFWHQTLSSCTALELI